MYIVAIGWLYVVLMMALTETSVTAGILTFLFYGLAPLALFLWLVGTPARRRRSADQAVDQNVGEADRDHTGPDQ
jgi:membrane protein implicated in regulation of membrane protease activity